MKLVALNLITDGRTTYKAGDVFESSKTFPEGLVKSGSAKYLEPKSEPKEEQEEEFVEVEIPENLEELSKKELGEILKSLKIEGYGNKNEAERIAMIEEAIAGEE